MSQLSEGASHAGVGEHLFLSEELSDVTLLVQNRWRYPAHRLVLSSQSAVFRRMLESNFAEKSTGSILIGDIRAEIIELLLGYMYRGRVSLQNWGDGIELLRAAHKYQVEPLVQFCSRFLENVVSISNVCHLYGEACLYSLPSLKEKCLRLILDAGFIVLRSKSFSVLDSNSVMDVIADPDLNIDSELRVFEALLRWAPLQCCRSGLPMSDANVLRELTPFLECVCFDDMSDTDKSALPPAVLSCLRPNNRNRVAHHVPDALLPFATRFAFRTEGESCECVGDALHCVSFSLDAPRHAIGLRFMVVTPESPPHMVLSLVRVCGGSSAVCHTTNLYSVAWKEGMGVGEGRRRWEAQILLRQPVRLDPRTVYKLLLTDRQQNTYCPRTKLHTGTLLVERGRVNLSLHTEAVWGVMELIFL